MKKNIIGLFLIISTFSAHASPLRFLAQASVLSVAAIGAKGALIVREKESAANSMTFEQVRNSLNTERKLWNSFGLARRIFKQEQQPTMKRIVLKKESDGSQIVLERDSWFFGKNSGTLKKIAPDSTIIQTCHIFGPMAKSEICAFAVGIGLTAYSSPIWAGFLAGSLLG